MGTAYHTAATPQMGAKWKAVNTRIARFTRLAMVNATTSPAPLSTPSVQVLNPMNTKNQPIKDRYPTPVINASEVLSPFRKLEIIGPWNIATTAAMAAAKPITMA